MAEREWYDDERGDEYRIWIMKIERGNIELNTERKSQVLRLVMWDGLKLVRIGTATGLLIAFLCTRLVDPQRRLVHI